MAKSTSTSSSKLHARSKSKRPGIHSKKKASKSKTAKNYKKAYRGQGR
jgi:hypothetical protein